MMIACSCEEYASLATITLFKNCYSFPVRICFPRGLLVEKFVAAAVSDAVLRTSTMPG